MNVKSLFYCLLNGILGVVGCATQVDVLILLSEGLIEDAGDESTARFWVEQEVVTANQIYADSEADVQLRVVGVEVFAPDGFDPSSTILFDLIEMLVSAESGLHEDYPVDGVYAGEVAAIRDRYGADLVALLIGNDESIEGLFGIASDLPRSTNAGNEEFMRIASYSITVYGSYPVSRFSFAHEIAHNLGAAHDVSSSGTGWTDSCRGFKITNEPEAITIMHSLGVVASTRVPFVSNSDTSVAYTDEFGIDHPIGNSSHNNVSGLNGSVATMSSIEDPRWFADSPIYDDKWRGGSPYWFGSFWVGSYPYVFHAVANRWLLEGSDNQVDDLWFFDYVLESWLWTTQSVWPWVYVANDDVWVELY